MQISGVFFLNQTRRKTANKFIGYGYFQPSSQNRKQLPVMETRDPSTEFTI